VFLNGKVVLQIETIFRCRGVLDSKIDSEARSFLAAITQQTIASLHDDDTNPNLEEIKVGRKGERKS